MIRFSYLTNIGDVLNTYIVGSNEVDKYAKTIVVLVQSLNLINWVNPKSSNKIQPLFANQ